MEYFLLNTMLACLQDIVRRKIQYRIPGYESADFAFALDGFPEQVIPLHRRRAYISGVLARNEVFGAAPYNRRLFLRLARGFYIPNPNLEIETTEDQWENVYDLIHIAALEQESDNPRLQELIRIVRLIQRDPTGGRAAAEPDLTARA